MKQILEQLIMKQILKQLEKNVQGDIGRYWKLLTQIQETKSIKESDIDRLYTSLSFLKNSIVQDLILVVNLKQKFLDGEKN